MPWPEISPSNFASLLTVAGIPGALSCDATEGEILVGFDSRIKPGVAATLNGKKVTIAGVKDPHEGDETHAENWMILTIETDAASKPRTKRTES